MARKVYQTSGPYRIRLTDTARMTRPGQTTVLKVEGFSYTLANSSSPNITVTAIGRSITSLDISGTTRRNRAESCEHQGHCFKQSRC